jgi:hypothetical protein
MDKKTVIVTQLIMTLMMAVSMSGIMSLMAVGPTEAWLSRWPLQALTAWPVAFVATMVLFPVASRITRLVLGKPAVANQIAE